MFVEFGTFVESHMMGCGVVGDDQDHCSALFLHSARPDIDESHRDAVSRKRSHDHNGDGMRAKSWANDDDKV